MSFSRLPNQAANKNKIMDSRQEDLKDIYEKMHEENTSVREREELDQIRHQILSQDDKDIEEARGDLIMASRSKDKYRGKAVKRISEKIKDITHQKGLERKG